MSTLTNMQPIAQFTDAHYDASGNHLRELWFRCHPRGFCYSVYDGHSKKIVLSESYEVADFFIISPDTLQGFLDSVGLFLNDFKNIKVIFENHLYTVLPIPFYEEEEAETYYKLKFDLQESEHLLSQRIPDFGAQIIYAAPRFMLNSLLAKFTDSAIREQVKVYHHVTVLLSALYYQPDHLNKEVCYVNLGETTFDIVLIKNSALVFCNSYEYHNPEDVLYFVMHAYQSQQLQPETHECYLTGYHPNQRSIHDLLYTFIKNLKQLAQDPIIPEGFTGSSLFLLQYCAS